MKKKRLRKKFSLTPLVKKKILPFQLTLNCK